MKSNQLFRYELGDEVRDIITGFKGIITSRTEYINGCVRYGVQPQTLKDGKTIDAEWTDEKQLKLVKSKRIEIEPERTGGPAAAPRTDRNPPRL